MTGIVSYGGYIPRKRLNRMSIYQGMGWYIPALISVAQGERSFANWDEDSLTMAVAAARNCVAGEVGRDDISAVLMSWKERKQRHFVNVQGSTVILSVSRQREYRREGWSRGVLGMES